MAAPVSSGWLVRIRTLRVAHARALPLLPPLAPLDTAVALLRRRPPGVPAGAGAARRQVSQDQPDSLVPARQPILCRVGHPHARPITGNGAAPPRGRRRTGGSPWHQPWGRKRPP